MTETYHQKIRNDLYEALTAAEKAGMSTIEAVEKTIPSGTAWINGRFVEIRVAEVQLDGYGSYTCYLPGEWPNYEGPTVDEIYGVVLEDRP